MGETGSQSILTHVTKPIPDLVADFGEDVQEFFKGVVPWKKRQNAGGDGKLGHGGRLPTKTKEKRTVFLSFDERV